MITKSNTYRSAILPFLLVILSMCWFEPQTASAEERAVGVVKILQSALLQTMQAGNSMGFPERYAQLDTIIRRTHDLPKVARISLGGYWRKLDKKQREQFVDVFSRLSISIYADRFKSYSGERFAIVSAKSARHGGMLVQTRLIKRSGEVVHLNYQLRQKKDGWRIVNVIANGVSDLALKRVEYSTAVKKHGFAALVSRLKAKIALYGR
ncbi:MAG: ABC transporter substrate-binding protein [Mariprofundaceae bacterium]